MVLSINLAVSSAQIPYLKKYPHPLTPLHLQHDKNAEGVRPALLKTEGGCTVKTLCIKG